MHANPKMESSVSSPVSTSHTSYRASPSALMRRMSRPDAVASRVNKRTARSGSLSTAGSHHVAGGALRRSRATLVSSSSNRLSSSSLPFSLVSRSRLLSTIAALYDEAVAMTAHPYHEPQDRDPPSSFARRVGCFRATTASSASSPDSSKQSRRTFTDEEKEKQSQVRRVGACLRCKMLKIQVSCHCRVFNIENVQLNRQILSKSPQTNLKSSAQKTARVRHVCHLQSRGSSAGSYPSVTVSGRNSSM